ncbi:MAG TPA: L-serine ammonia-lyase, iron-sulfur-dependent, subunit alpha [Candidatus Lachnoclostridium avicola]|nr:L-serine ammonia-lyase, iron-sulfur-dependent, subunit alpha [Candidatus Lachnoclostridium avicola]
MEQLTKLIREDMKPALGVTEPGAIAFAVSKARSYVGGKLDRVELTLNSGMYKNAFTCGIPGSRFCGNEYAAALGVLAGKPEKGLECLAAVTDMDNAMAEILVKTGRIQVHMSEITSRIFIEAKVTAEEGEAVVTIRDSHTNIVKIQVNGETVFSKEEEEKGEETGHADIHGYTLQQIYDYAVSVPAEEISFIQDAYKMNWKLFEEGLHSDRTTYAPYLLKKNGGQVISDDEQKTASLLCNAAIEARVIGLDSPAMSITGSGAHGIIATMPLYGVYLHRNLPEEKLWRATAISYLVCMYIKEYSGKLSAFCGCGIAAGTGMACGLVYLNGGGPAEMERTIDNMASSLTGMICDGGNQGCTMKGIVAVDAAFQSVDFAMHGISIDPIHGINGKTPEETMRHMGEIASPGMVGTEKTIVDILQEKSGARG